MDRLNESEQRIRAAELAAARAVAEREDAEAVIEELRDQLSGCLERTRKAEAEVCRLRREVIESRDQQDELVEANAELVVQAERIRVLEQRLSETQTSAAYIRELENSKEDLQRQLDDRDDRITSLLQKLGEIKDRQAVDVETEMLRLRLKHAETRLAEELQHREALERDVRSQQSVVQQMQIDKRIAEKLKKQNFLEATTPNGHADAISSNGDAIMDPSFEVATSAISGYLSPPPSNGENLGSFFQIELESARSRIQSLETKLREALMQAEDAEAEASRLKEVISRLHADQDAKETAVASVYEAKTAAETAHRQLTDDLATLEARLQFDFSSAGLITPEAVRFAESLAKMLTDREDDVQVAWERVNKLTLELQAICSIEKVDKDVQTTWTSCLDSPCVSIQTDPDLEAHEERRGLSNEVVRLNDELVGSVEALTSAREEISDLHDRLRELESECTQERALSARAQHQLALSQQEAWKVQAQLERLRTKVAAHIEMLAAHGLGREEVALRQHLSASSASDLTTQLKSIATHLIINHDHQEELFRENERLKEEVYALRIQLDTNRTIQKRLRDLNETSEFLESKVNQLLHRRPHRHDNYRDRNGHRRLSSPNRFSIEEEAQDTDADGLAYTDLSQFASTSSSSLSTSPRKPADSSRWQPRERAAPQRRPSDLSMSCASAPLARPSSVVALPLHALAASSSDQADSLEVSTSSSLDGVDFRGSADAANGCSEKSVIRESRGELFALLRTFTTRCNPGRK
uniref:GRIP domain-containing protein n=1 Tax=Mesocestoides corti TaxID=53468 RepID=A0A5K3F437_MESCO